MASRILDASAFYAGIPFRSQETHHTTPMVLEEVRHIKKSHDAIGTLVEAGRLRVVKPGAQYAAAARERAAYSGDAQTLSESDISVLALALELNGEILTDDFAISNTAAGLGIGVLHSMTGGIRRAGRWIYYCAGCGVQFFRITECPRCGNALRRRLASKDRRVRSRAASSD